MTLLISLLNMLETRCEYLKALREFHHTVPTVPTWFVSLYYFRISSQFDDLTTMRWAVDNCLCFAYTCIYKKKFFNGVPSLHASL
jgi:hypothetical protein